MSSLSSDDLFAQYLTQVGVASFDQIEAARALQAQHAAKGKLHNLPDVLVSQGVLTAAMRANIEKKLQAKQAGGVKQLGTFKLLKKLGEGGMGAVYLAEDTAVGRKVALKVLPQKHAKDSEFLTRFRREAKAAGKLNHPNIVAAYSVGEEMGHHFYSMEYCEGEPLDARLKRQSTLPWDEAVDITLQVARGLEHAHKHGFIHRDIKPANVFRGNDGMVKILDLGLSKNILDAESSFATQSGIAMGTPHYISPEQARGQRDVDGRSDIYSLGATLYHFITGQTPFHGSTAALIMMKHLSEELPNPQDLVPDLPDGVVEVIQKMMAKDSADRYSGCDALIGDLELIKEGKPPAGSALDIGKSSIAMRAMPKRAGAGAKRGGTAGPLHPVGSQPGRRPTHQHEPVGEKRGEDRRAGDRRGEPKKNPALLIAAGIFGVGLLAFILSFMLGGTPPEPAKTESALLAPVTTPPPASTVTVDPPKAPPEKPPVAPPVAAVQAAPTPVTPPKAPVATQAVKPPVAPPAPTLAAVKPEMRTYKGHAEYTSGIDISANEKWIIAGSKDKSIRLWSVEHPEQVRVLSGHTGIIRGVAFSRDNRFAASGAEDNTLRLWDVDKGAEVLRCEGVTSKVNGVVFSPDSKRVAAGLDDNTLAIWNVATGKLIRKFSGHTQKVMGVAFSPDGKRLLSGGADRALRLWDVESGTLLKSITEHASTIHGVAVSPDGTQAVTSSEDSTVLVFDLEQGDDAATLKGHGKKTWGVVFTPDGKRVLSAGEDKTVRLWDVRSGKELQRFDVGSEAGELRITADGTRCLVGLQDKTVRLFSLAATAPAAAALPPNILLAEDFNGFDLAALPKDWTAMGNLTLVDSPGRGRVLRIRSVGGGYPKLEIPVDIAKVRGRTVRVSVLARCAKGFTPLQDKWACPRLLMKLTNAQGTDQRDDHVNPADTEWKRLTVMRSVPEEARFLHMSLEIAQVAAEADFDDLTVELDPNPNKPPPVSSEVVPANFRNSNVPAGAGKPTANLAPFAGARVGDWAEYSMATTHGDKTLPSTMRKTIIQKTETEVFIEAVVKSAAQEKKNQLRLDLKQIAAPGQAPPGSKLLKTGTETLTISGRALKTTYTQYETAMPLEGKMTMLQITQWTCPDVPFDGIVKSETIRPDFKATSELKDFGFGPQR